MQYVWAAILAWVYTSLVSCIASNGMMIPGQGEFQMGFAVWKSRRLLTRRKCFIIGTADERPEKDKERRK